MQNGLFARWRLFTTFFKEHDSFRYSFIFKFGNQSWEVEITLSFKIPNLYKKGIPWWIMVVVSSKIIAIVQTGKLKKKHLTLIYTFNIGYKTAHLLYASLFKALNLFNFPWSRSSPGHFSYIYKGWSFKYCKIRKISPSMYKPLQI